MNAIQIKTPYVIFLGDIEDKTLAKTGAGLVKWCPEQVLGQVRFGQCKVDLGIPDFSIAEAKASGARSLIVGVATIGGEISPLWLPLFVEALECGIDLVNGLHTNLAAHPDLIAASQRGKSRVVNLRQNKAPLPIGNGKKRQGMRLLTVGTDCAVGKKYTALTMTKELQARGYKATFRATGQTGIAIAGEGLPVDSIVCDFVSGAAEIISPNNEPDHWDVIEGQGSLFNPSFSAVTMGLLHGSQPDALIMCHDAERTIVCTCPEQAIPSIPECIDLNLRCARIVNPNVRCIGVSVNTSSLPAEERLEYLKKLSEECGLPCVDPLIDGCGPLIDMLISSEHSAQAKRA